MTIRVFVATCSEELSFLLNVFGPWCVLEIGEYVIEVFVEIDDAAGKVSYWQTKSKGHTDSLPDLFYVKLTCRDFCPKLRAFPELQL